MTAASSKKKKKTAKKAAKKKASKKASKAKATKKVVRKPLRKKGRRTRDDKVRQVLGMMSSCSWSATSVEDLAAEWGESKHTVHQVHAEAARLVRLSLGGDLEATRNQFLAECDALVRQALERRAEKPIYNPSTKAVEVHAARDPDIKSAVAALQLKGKTFGLLQSKLQIDHVEHRVQGMSESEVDEALKAFASGGPEKAVH